MMHTMSEEFEWFLPEEKNPLALSIPNWNTINFNPKLLPLLPDRVTIGIKENGKELCLCAHEKGFRPRKSGSVRGQSKAVIARLVALGIRLPARYLVTAEEGRWMARLDSQAPPIPTLKRTSRKAKEKGKDASGLLREMGLL